MSTEFSGLCIGGALDGSWRVSKHAWIEHRNVGQFPVSQFIDVIPQTMASLKTETYRFQALGVESKGFWICTDQFPGGRATPEQIVDALAAGYRVPLKSGILTS
jgi:hypothetical protein